MALESIGVLVALCATLTIAIDGEVRFQPEHEYYHEPNNINYHPHLEPIGNKHFDFKRHSGFSHSSDESGEWEHRGFPKPHFPHSSDESGEWGHHGFPKPHFSNNLDDSRPHHVSIHEAEESNHHGLHKPHFSPSSQEHNWGHKIHRPDWYNPHFPQQPLQTNKYFEEMERRRPLFYPIFPYHPYHLYGHPSTNDEEFETIEAMKRDNFRESLSRRIFVQTDDSIPEVSEQQKYEKPYYYGLHNPHFPLNSDSSKNSAEILFGPFHHGFLKPNFKPFHKKPVIPEENDVLAPIITDDHYINGDDDDFPTPDEAQPYEPPPLPLDDEKEHMKLPNVIIDILEHLHHGHGKPHHHGVKPNDDENENIADEDGSGEEELIPLVAEANVPLIQDNV